MSTRRPGNGSGWDDDDDRDQIDEGAGTWKERYERGRKGIGSDVQNIAEGTNQGYAMLAYLLGGLLVWGGIGWLIDTLTGFHYLFLPIGSFIGLAGGIYLTVMAAKKQGTTSQDPRDGEPG